MKIKKLLSLLTGLLACVLLISGCAGQADKKLGSAAISIPTYAVKAPSAGKILGLISEKDERISKGQPLFAVEDTKLDKQVKALAAQVAKAEADLKRMQLGTPQAVQTGNLALAQANVAAAQQKAAKMNSLLAQGAVSRSQAQAAQNELNQAVAQLQAATSVTVSMQPASPAQIEAQQKLIEQLKKQQAKALAQQQKNEAQSPCTGVITDLLLQTNAVAAKDQVVLQIKATDSCTLTLNVSDAQAKALEKDMAVNLKADNIPASFAGSISAIDGTKVTITSEKKPEGLADGSKVEVTLAN